MLSAWDARASGPEFRNADAAGVIRFPGFHVAAAQYLMGERNAIGIAVDTLSLHYGKLADFAIHAALERRMVAFGHTIRKICC
jgi:kynurenine formamidase